MGLFFNRKNKKKNKQASIVKDDHIIEVKDRSGNLIGELNDTNYEDPYKNYDNPKFHRAEDEINLKADFSKRNYQLIERYEKRIEIGHKNENSYQIKQRIQAFDEFKNYCYNHSQGAKLYFQDMWEHCHNSKNECFSWREKLTEQYQTHKEKEELLKKIPEFVQLNPGIIRANLWLHFPDYEKSNVRAVTKDLINNQVIKQEKYKSKNVLYIN